AWKAYCGDVPLSGRLKIHHPCSCPRPPKPILPAPTPPRGKEIIWRRDPVKTRGYSMAERGTAFGGASFPPPSCNAPPGAALPDTAALAPRVIVFRNVRLPRF